MPRRNAADDLTVRGAEREADQLAQPDLTLGALAEVDGIEAPRDHPAFDEGEGEWSRSRPRSRAAMLPARQADRRNPAARRPARLSICLHASWEPARA
ncbi:MAG: hypothetical protein ACKV22_21520 [Bryobacteraceae bacterium]